MTLDSMGKTIVSAMAALVAAGVAAPMMLGLLRRIGSRQEVSEHVPEHQKKQGTPTMGGLVVIVGVVVAFLVANNPSNGFSFFLFLWFAAIGFLDDFVVPRMIQGKRGLGWAPKLVLQFLPFLYLWWTSPGTPVWMIGVTTFVVLLAANAYNFCDGMDGLAGGVGMVFASALIVVSFVLMPDSLGQRLVPVLAGLALSFVPFLLLNAPPAKVFMGDVGSLPIGALLGMGLLESTLFARPLAPNWTAFLLTLPLLGVFLAELVPVPLQIASAKLRKGKRMFPFRTPVHHAFEAAGWPETRVSSMFVLVQMILAAITVALIYFFGWQGGGHG